MDTYEAISYVWGDPSDTIEIICQGKPFLVTRNLANALQRVRSTTESKSIWADAVCINQQDDNEKGHQVSRMGSIYEHARTVLVWLGKDELGIANECFQFIIEANKVFDRFSRAGPREKTEMIGIYNTKEYIRGWSKVDKLTDLPWFQRLWVVQESGLAKECTLMWGQYELDIAELVEAGILYEVYPELRLQSVNWSGRVTKIFTAIQCQFKNKQTWRTSKRGVEKVFVNVRNVQLTFLDLLNSTKRLNTTDARDRVYAFLGSPLASISDNHSLLEINYGTPTREVYRKIACSLLERPREARWVLPCVHHGTADISQCLPTWTPQWDRYFDAATIGIPLACFCAGGLDPFFSQVKDGAQLIVQGWAFDSLSWISAPIRAADFSLNRRDWTNELLESQNLRIDILWNELQEIAKCPASQIQDSFNLTLVFHRMLVPEMDTPIDVQKLQADFEVYRNVMRKILNTNTPLQPQLWSTPSFQRAANLLDDMGLIDNWRLAYSQDGKIGLAPFSARAGDLYVILPGVNVPFLLRPTGRNTYYLVGECYLHGVMQGEMMEELNAGKFKKETLVIE